MIVRMCQPHLAQPLLLVCYGLNNLSSHESLVARFDFLPRLHSLAEEATKALKGEVVQPDPSATGSRAAGVQVILSTLRVTQREVPLSAQEQANKAPAPTYE
jgi:hypothetical protein